jgi:hypothetical protein
MTSRFQQTELTLEENNGSVRRLQVKGRCLLPDCEPGQRLGSIDATKDWDAVLLVLLDQNFEANSIYEAERHRYCSAFRARFKGVSASSSNRAASLAAQRYQHNDAS